MLKYLDTINLRKKGFIFGSQFDVTAHHGGEGMVVGAGSICHMTPSVRKQRGMKVCSFSFYSVQAPSLDCGIVLPVEKVNLLTSVTVI